MPTTTRSARSFTRSGLGAEHLLQLAGLVHLAHDVRAADEFAVDVELRDRRPVGVLLDALTDLGVCENVDCVGILHAAGDKELDRQLREAALRELRGSLHVEHDAMSRHLVLDSLLDIHAGHFTFPPVTLGIRARSGQFSISSSPARSSSSRTARSCPMPCSSSSRPPVARWPGAAQAISLISSRPSLPPMRASIGSKCKCAKWRSFAATYGGLATMRSKRSPASGSSHRPCRNSTSRPCFTALRCATASAAALESVATTCAFGRWRLIASAIAPLPVPRSAIDENSSCSARSTSSSVSGRGMSTAGLTARLRP